MSNDHIAAPHFTRFELRRRPLDIGPKVFLSILVLGHISVAQTYNLFADADLARFVSVLFILGSLCYFSVLAFIQQKVLALFMLAVVVCYFLFNLQHFSSLSGLPINIKAIAEIYGLSSLIVFCYFIDKGSLGQALQIVFFWSILYAMFYIIISSLYAAGWFSYLGTTSASLHDTLRGNRLVMVAFVSTFAYMCCLVRICHKFSLRYFLLGLIALSAILLSQSRSLLVVVAFVTMLYVLIGARHLNILKLCCFLLFLCISLVLLYGLLDHDFNPFTFSMTDEDTIGRRLTYDVFRVFIDRYWLFGFGLPNSNTDLIYFLGARADPTDVGIFGIWSMFGIVGVLLLVASVYICCFQKIDLNDNLDSRLLGRALVLTGNAIGISTSFSPDIWLGSGSIFFAILLANQLNRYSAWRLSSAPGRGHTKPLRRIASSQR